MRELQNVVERAVIVSDVEDTLSVDEAWLRPESPRPTGAVIAFVNAIVDREREMIESALAQSHGRIAGPSGAAIRLGMPRQTLESKIRALSIDKHRFGSPR